MARTASIDRPTTGAPSLDLSGLGVGETGSANPSTKPNISLSVLIPTPAAVGSLPVLARLPELATAVTPIDDESKLSSPLGFARRLLGSNWAQWVLLGGGLLMFLAALLPFVGGRSHREVDTSLQAPWQPATKSPAPPVPPAADQSNLPRRSPTTTEMLQTTSDPSPKSPSAGTAPTADLSSDATATPWPAVERTEANASMSLETPRLGAVPRPPDVPLADRQMGSPPMVMAPETEPLQPGMARLDGVIERPSLRTGFDAGRPARY